MKPITQTEQEEATRLALWMDSDHAAGIDSEELVVVCAMRPDWIPVPRLRLEDILSKVTRGPFAQQVELEESPSEEQVEFSEDDFVAEVFAVLKQPTPKPPSFDTVFARVATGPLREQEKSDVSQEVHPVGLDELSDSETVQDTNVLLADSKAANNNRWWSAPWITGGLAVALVLFVLIPVNFQRSPSSESIFAPVYEEEALDASDIPTEQQVMKEAETAVKARSVSKPAPQKTKQLQTDEQRLQEAAIEEPVLSNQPRSDVALKEEMALEKSVSNKGAVAGGVPQSVQVAETKSVAQPKKQDVFGMLGTVEADKALAQPGRMSANLSQGGSGFQEERASHLDDLGQAEAPSPMDEDSHAADTVVLGANTGLRQPVVVSTQEEPATDLDSELLSGGELEEGVSVTQTVGLLSSRSKKDRSVALDMGVGKAAAKKSEAKNQPSAPMYASEQEPVSAELPPSEPMEEESAEAVFEDQVLEGLRKEVSSADDGATFAPEAKPSAANKQAVGVGSEALPRQISTDQQAAIAQARTVTEVLSLCSIEEPTLSLDVLWLASYQFSRNESIELLLKSQTYDHGDLRYLKRNWLRLAELYQLNGQQDKAETYRERASTLP